MKKHKVLKALEHRLLTVNLSGYILQEPEDRRMKIIYNELSAESKQFLSGSKVDPLDLAFTLHEITLMLMQLMELQLYMQNATPEKLSEGEGNNAEEILLSIFGGEMREVAGWIDRVYPGYSFLVWHVFAKVCAGMNAVTNYQLSQILCKES